MKTAALPNALGSDTVMYSASIDANKVIPGHSLVIGPYFISLGNSNRIGLRQNNAFSIKEETGDIFAFTVCRKNLCAYAESYFYEKTKTTLVGGKNGGIRVTGEKIYGQIYFNDQPVINFEVNRMGKLRGYGFCRVSENETIRIKPIGKRTNYGKKPYRVGLNFTIDDKIIGSFVHTKDQITVAVRNGLDENMNLILIALSLALINRSNEIRIF